MSSCWLLSGSASYKVPSSIEAERSISRAHHGQPTPRVLPSYSDFCNGVLPDEQSTLSPVLQDARSSCGWLSNNSADFAVESATKYRHLESQSFPLEEDRPETSSDLHCRLNKADCKALERGSTMSSDTFYGTARSRQAGSDRLRKGRPQKNEEALKYIENSVDRKDKKWLKFVKELGTNQDDELAGRLFKCLHRKSSKSSHEGDEKICDYIALRQTVRRHVESIHLGIIPYSCKFCGKKFAQRQAAAIHVNTIHLKIRNNECEHCGARFSDPSRKNKHVGRYHPEAPVKSRRKVPYGHYSYIYLLSRHRMPQKLGSAAIYEANLTRQTVHVTTATCNNLSLFKEMLKEYRKLDDTIIMRLNRANARMRDRDRRHPLSENHTLQDQACDNIWRELVDVVDQCMTEKRAMLNGQEPQDPSFMRKIRGQMYADEVKRKQIHNELTVEDIVRKRTVAAFRSQCQYFVPPMTDEEARKLWDAASR